MWSWMLCIWESLAWGSGQNAWFHVKLITRWASHYWVHSGLEKYCPSRYAKSKSCKVLFNWCIELKSSQLHHISPVLVTSATAQQITCWLIDWRDIGKVLGDFLLYDKMSLVRMNPAGQQKAIVEAAENYSWEPKKKRNTLSAFYAGCISTGNGVITAARTEKIAQDWEEAWILVLCQ